MLTYYDTICIPDFSNPLLTLAIQIFLILKASNLVPTTGSSELAPPSPWNAQSSSLQGRLLTMFQVSAKMSLPPRGLCLTTVCKNTSVTPHYSTVFLSTYCLLFYRLPHQIGWKFHLCQSTNQFTIPSTGTDNRWNINTCLLNEWMIPSKVYVTNNLSLFMYLSEMRKMRLEVSFQTPLFYTDFFFGGLKLGEASYFVFSQSGVIFIEF